jgi:6-methylsalicylate decarboxylase
MSTTRRIDVHHHILTPDYIEALAKVGVVQAGGHPFPRWKPADSLAVMDRYEIDTALLSVSAPGLCFGDAIKARDMARSLNEFAATCVAHAPLRFGFFATLPLPDVDAALVESSYALDQLSADGIGLLSNYEGIYLGDPRFESLFAELDRRAAVIHIHPTVFTGSEIPSARNAGSPLPTVEPSVLEFVFDTTRAVANLIFSGTLKRYPHLRIILSHAGGAVPLFSERLMDRSEILAVMQKVQAGQAPPPSPEELEALMQTALESTFRQLRALYYDTALSTNNTVLSALQRLVPSSQILLGTDYPFAQEAGIRYALEGLATYAGFSEQDRKAIESQNALKLFPRLQA